MDLPRVNVEIPGVCPVQQVLRTHFADSLPKTAVNNTLDALTGKLALRTMQNALDIFRRGEIEDLSDEVANVAGVSEHDRRILKFAGSCIKCSGGRQLVSPDVSDCPLFNNIMERILEGEDPG
jgi:hypothetical protein